MIDTIVLMLNRDYVIKKHDKFVPNSKGLFEPPYYKFPPNTFIFPCVYKPNDKDYEKFGYLPKITITKIKKQNFYPIMRIEFSVPKILFGNNFYELEDTDFNGVLDNLKSKLEILGIWVEKETLKNASVLAIHYSKNIVLEKGLQISSIINYLAKTNISSSLDISKKDFRNNGTSLTLHTNSYEVTFYDKIKDIKQAKISEKRSIEKYNICNIPFIEHNFFEKYSVLRIEVRLNKKIIITKLLNKINMNTPLTFDNLFNSIISQKIISYYWFEVTKDIYLCFNKANYIDILICLLKNKKLSLKNALISIALMALTKEEGFRSLESTLCEYYSRKWVRKIKSEYISALDTNTLNCSQNHILTPIDKALRIFKTMQKNIKEMVL